MVSYGNNITASGYAMDAKQNNGSISGTLRNRIEFLCALRLANQNIKDISEIFDYERYEIALFSDWEGNSSLSPCTFSMILRIPNLDAVGAKCICIGHDAKALWTGNLHFTNKKITWVKIGGE